MAVKNKINNKPHATLTSQMVNDLSGEQINACYQCQKCSNGCPLTFAMDIAPHQVMHNLQLGLIDEVIDSDTIWVCSSCQTCTTRCPNSIDIAHVMDTLRQLSVKKGIKASQQQVHIFHQAFLNNVKNLGRMHELSMAVDFSLKAGGFKGLLKQAGFGMNMLRKGKMKLVPGRLKSGKEVKSIFHNTEEKQA